MYTVILQISLKKNDWKTFCCTLAVVAESPASTLAFLSVGGAGDFCSNHKAPLKLDIRFYTVVSLIETELTCRGAAEEQRGAWTAGAVEAVLKSPDKMSRASSASILGCKGRVGQIWRKEREDIWHSSRFLILPSQNVMLCAYKENKPIKSVTF